MNTLDHMTAVWRQAAHDLGFKLIAPFTLADEERTLSYPGLIPQFGSPKGMLVIVGLHYDDHVRVAQQQGYGYSCFSEDSQPYDRDAFPPAMQVPRRTLRWLSLGSLGASTRLP